MKTNLLFLLLSSLTRSNSSSDVLNAQGAPGGTLALPPYNTNESTNIKNLLTILGNDAQLQVPDFFKKTIAELQNNEEFKGFLIKKLQERRLQTDSDVDNLI